MAMEPVGEVTASPDHPVLGAVPYFAIELPGTEVDGEQEEARLHLYRVEPERLRDVLIQLIQAL